MKLDKKGGQTVGLPNGNKMRLAVTCPALKAILCEYAGDLAPRAFLWPAECNNKPRMKKRTYDVWEGIVAKCGLPADMSPHDCRLSYINWIEKLLPEVSPTTLKEHVGHASGSSVTEINHTLPLTPAQDILRNGIERLAGDASSKSACSNRVGSSHSSVHLTGGELYAPTTQINEVPANVASAQSLMWHALVITSY